MANEERILPITFPRDWEAPQLAGGTFDGRIVLKVCLSAVGMATGSDTA